MMELLMRAEWGYILCFVLTVGLGMMGIWWVYTAIMLVALIFVMLLDFAGVL
jgi:hypothetical protein